MTKGGWIAKGLLALVGIIVGTFLAAELIGGALGWTLGGAVIAGCAHPLFKSLMEWRRQKDERVRREKEGG